MKRLLVAIAVAMLLVITGISVAWAATFSPADPADTDSGILIDNFEVTVNGTAVNSNSGFETGSLFPFETEPIPFEPPRIITGLGAIAPPSGNQMAFLHTGPATDPARTTDRDPPRCPGAIRDQRTVIIQPVTLVSGNTVAMSVDIDFLTNEPGVGPHFTIDLIEFAFSKPPDAAGGGPQAIWFLKIFDVKGLLGTRPNPVGAVVGLAPGTVPVEPLPAPLVPAPGTGFAGHTGFVHFDIPVPQNVVDAFLVTFPDGNFIVEMNVHECFVEPPPPPKPCLPMGIFAGGDPAADLVHNWTLRSPQDGQIDLKIGALTVNAANGGAVKAVITDETGEQMVEVAHPTQQR